MCLGKFPTPNPIVSMDTFSVISLSFILFKLILFFLLSRCVFCAI